MVNVSSILTMSTNNNKYNNMKNRKFSHITFLQIIAILYGIMIIGGLATVIFTVITEGAPNFNLV